MALFVRKKKAGNIFIKKPEVSQDGLLLEIINSFPSTHGPVGEACQQSEVIFVQATINISGEVLAAGDCHGNIFVFDLIRNRFSLVKHLSVPCTRMTLNLKHKSQLLVALSDYTVRCFDYETGEALGQMRGHSSAITDLSVHMSKRYALSSSSETAFLWNLDTFERKRKLSISQTVDLLKAFFIPCSQSILTCFKDNSMLVWDAESMTLLHELRSTMAYDVNYRTYSCNADGTRLLAAGKSHILHIWDVTAAKIIKALQLPLETKSVRQVAYLPKHWSNDELILAVCSNGVMRVINTQTNCELLTIGTYEHKVLQVNLCVTGSLIVCLMDSGNLRVYDLESVLKKIDSKPAGLELDGPLERPSSADSVQRKSKTVKVRMCTANKLKDMITQRVESSRTLNNVKLREILEQYGEFPERYRTFIWKTVLKIPENYQCYSELLDKGIHPAFSNIQSVYPIRSQKLLRVFQRLLSAVAYWAPVTTECTFLPVIAFPFTKLLQNNQLIAFEVVATVLLNWCYKWTDFLPNPPLNILSLAENIFSYHDKQLFQHFIKYRVTTQTYIWSLLETGFSEVFTRDEWMRLWDHVIINDSSWILYAAVAYTLVNRTPLMGCYELEEFKQFYRHQNATGVGRVIKETYKLVNTTPSDLNPQPHLQAFTPLNSDKYQLYAKFPQRIKNFQQTELDRIRQEQLELLRSDDQLLWTKR